jgi:hypothetical protein
MTLTREQQERVRQAVVCLDKAYRILDELAQEPDDDDAGTALSNILGNAAYDVGKTSGELERRFLK